MNTITVNAGLFDKAVRFAEKATTREDGTLDHIAIEVEGDNLLLIGCDRFRVHKGILPIQDSHVEDSQWFIDRHDVLVAIRQYKKVVKPKKRDSMTLLLGDLGIAVLKNGKMSVTVPKDNYGYSYRGNTRHTTIVYPDWRQVWPTDGRTVTLDQEQLVTVAKAAIVAAKENDIVPVVWLREHRGQLVARVPRRHHGKYSRATVRFGDIVGQVDFASDTGTRFDFSVNAKYLLDALYGVSESEVGVTVQEDKNLAPVIIGNAVVMPVDIRQGGY